MRLWTLISRNAAAVRCDGCLGLGSVVCRRLLNDRNAGDSSNTTVSCGSRTEAAADLLRDAEQRHGLRFAVLTENAPEDNRDEWYESHLWPFLSETQFVVTAGDLFFDNGWSLIDTSRVDHTPTWRHWGGVVAEWANRHWLARPGGLGQTIRSQAHRPWEYLDFYMDVYLEDIVDGYRDWRSAILRVLDAKEGRPAAG